jgi:four helix bundle protein
MGFTSYREINSWKKARLLTTQIYTLTNTGPLRRDFGLKDQMRRSAVSVMSNIAEGFGRGGNREFIHFLSQARGSVLELETQITIALDVEYINEDQHEVLADSCQTIKKLIGGLIRYLQKSDKRGSKFSTSAQ